MTGIPKLLRWSAGPMPESIRSCGVFKAPADMITSLLAFISNV